MNKLIASLFVMILIAACKKTVFPTKQAEELTTTSADKKGGGGTTGLVSTTSVNAGATNSATANGNVSGGNISERGFCYSAGSNPTIADDTARAGSGAGSFQRLITGLSSGTTYYVKAYAIKNNVVYYGNELSFTTLTLGMPSPGIGTVADIDGNVYNTIILGTQIWMVENLKTTRYRDGSLIPNVTDNTAWTTASSGAYCNYDNNPANSADYGRLYNLYAIKDSRNLAPTGWHIPNNAEWNTVINYLGGSGIAGGRMKEAGLAHWDSPNTAADNSSWFTALGSGYRLYGGEFYNLKKRASFWSSSSSYSGSVTFPFINAFLLSYNTEIWTQQAGSIQGGTAYGYAVRCIKD